ncbi:allene oxide synthase-lipoxygenase protein-like [Diadema antillarum]|uniref:allene oxide synthase-lipoxygenase protein-like n=1 Tax=Diadema antillarum TaxID=105358 RepID=UPI003A865B03
MGSGASRKLKPDYTVHVRTGDRKGAGTDADVFIAFYNERGERSRDISLNCLWKDDFERGDVDCYPVSRLASFGPVERIELWRGESDDDWFVDMVEVEQEVTRKRFVFPVHRWVRADTRLNLKKYDTSLPQDDDQQEQRKRELERKRELYQLESKQEGLIPQVKDFPVDESFSNDYKWDIVKNKASLMLQAKIITLTTDAWQTLDDISELYRGKLPKPYGLENWRSDKEFGYQRLTGCNPTQIRLCTEIPEKFPVTDDLLAPLLEGMTIAEALEKKRLFILDYEILKDLPCTDGRSICAPMCLFFVNKDRNLMPVAIQLSQEPGEDSPVFLPTDQEYLWLMAKMWFNNADASFHQSATHLGYTHLVIESVAVATHRCLSASHPIFRLLAPHFLYLIAINTRALAKLVSEGGWVDRCMGIGRIGMFEIIKRTWARWSLDREGSLLADLEHRGVADPEVLPNYHYRDDALLVRKALHDYVSSIVKHYYTSDEKVKSDYEIQEWGRIMAPCSEGSPGHCGVKGLPNDGKFETVTDLIEVVTNFIFISSVGHAAANFSQYDEYGFPPNYPSFLFGRPPSDKMDRDEKDILSQLPSKDMTVSVMLVTQLLSDRGTNGLGDFEVQYIYDPFGKKVVKKFRSDLKKIGAIIDERNATREAKYPYLHPKEVPNAISI